MIFVENVNKSKLLGDMKHVARCGTFVVFVGNGAIVLSHPSIGGCVSCDAGKIEFDFFAIYSWALGTEARENLLEVAFQVVEIGVVLAKKHVDEQLGESLVDSGELQLILDAFRFGACVRLHCSDSKGVEEIEELLEDLANILSIEQIRAHGTVILSPQPIAGLSDHRCKLDSLATETNSLIGEINARRPARRRGSRAERLSTH